MSQLADFKLDEALRSLDSVQLAKVSGRLVRVSGMVLESLGCQRMTGQRCQVEQADGSLLEAQVVGFNREISYLMPFKKPVGLMAGSRRRISSALTRCNPGTPLRMPCSSSLCNAGSSSSPTATT